MNKTLVTKILLELSRVLIGATFIFSGFVKAIDPRGFAYKIEDYFSAFGLSALDSLALPIAIGLSMFEFILGAFMILGIYRKWTSRFLLFIMLIMTPLTLYLAIENPVSDCGCFGEAWIISNWETFFKNIVLLVCAVFLRLNSERITNLFTGRTYWLASFFIISYIFVFAVYNTIYEPVIDFRPYKIGENLRELTIVPEGEADEYEYVFIYEKDGERREFTEDTFPQDTTWNFVDRKEVLIKKGKESAITDLHIFHLRTNADGTEFVEEDEITDDILNFPSYTFLMIAYSLQDMNEAKISQFEDVYNYAQERGYEFYVLTSSLKDDILKWKKNNAVDFEFCNADDRTVLKLMTRSNPGMLVLKDGVVVKKWADFQVPEENSLTDTAEVLFQASVIAPETIYMRAILTFFIPLLLLVGIDAPLYRRKNKKSEEKSNI